MFSFKLKNSSFLSLIIILLILNLKNANAEANLKLSNSSSRYWISTGFFSYHGNRKANYNETNTGIGFEYYLDEESAIGIGHYKNSERRQSTYLNYVYLPFKIGNTRFGGAVGIVNGYPELRNGKFAPALLPVASTTFKVFERNVGFNVVYIPSVASNVDSALAIQFKLALN